VLETLVGLLAAALGFGAKSAFDAWADKKKELELEAWKLRVSTLQQRLSLFYWPLYLRLQRDNVVWRRILERSDNDDTKRKIAHQVEQDVILPNHREAVALIERGIHVAAIDPEFEAELLKYLRHVAVYTSARSAGLSVDPMHLNEPWPQDFFPMVESRLERYQAELLDLLRKQGVG
jgi:hypothetical protein